MVNKPSLSSHFLPRKFKIAVTGSPFDRAVTKAHDIGLRMVRDCAGKSGYEVTVGGIGKNAHGWQGSQRVPAKGKSFKLRRSYNACL